MGEWLYEWWIGQDIEGIVETYFVPTSKNPAYTKIGRKFLFILIQPLIRNYLSNYPYVSAAFVSSVCGELCVLIQNGFVLINANISSISFFTTNIIFLVRIRVQVLFQHLPGWTQKYHQHNQNKRLVGRDSRRETPGYEARVLATRSGIWLQQTESWLSVQ
jgi:hypothetical protein